MIKRRQNTKVLPYKPKQGRGARFEQDESYMSSALRKMAEQRRNANCSEKRECSSEYSSDDRISMLPDDLLGLILSRVSLKEHVATSILSRRWRYLWTLTTTRLNFDGNGPLAPEMTELNYVSWVNHVLQSRKSFMVKDFKVYFNLGKIDQECIDAWLRYALAWKVKTLELNLTNNHITTGWWWKDLIGGNYVFPYSFLQENSPNLLHFKQLKKVLLNYVDVNGEALEFFLHNCPLLEDLSVSHSSELSTLRVTGPFPSLKRLEISMCRNLQSLHICDVVNLVYLSYGGGCKDILLRELPMLVNLSLTTYRILKDMNGIVVQFRSILEQLEILNIDVNLPTFRFPLKMSNLKQLVVTCKLKHSKSSLPLTSMIRSAPCLQKFVLQGHHPCVKYYAREFQRTKMKKNLYSQLKEVEFFGFRGVQSDLEFVFHFVDNARALEKIVIDPKLPCTNPYYHVFRENVYTVALDRAQKHLAKKVPSNIKLDFLSLF